MVNSGHRIVNPISGEEIIFRKTAADTRGSLLTFDFLLHPGGSVATEHIHPRREERVEVRSGTLLVRVNGTDTMLHAGDRLVIPPGTPHRMRHPDPHGPDVTAGVQFTPAGRIAEFLDEVFALAATGHTDGQGRLSLLQAALTTAGHFDDVALARPPLPLQRILLAALRPLAHLRGYRRHYPTPPSP